MVRIEWGVDRNLYTSKPSFWDRHKRWALAYRRIAYWLTVYPRLVRLRKQLLIGSLVFPMGSRVVCAPPVMGTDIDFMVYSPDIFVIPGYKKTSIMVDDDYIMADNKITCYRRGKVNLIVTDDLDWYQRYLIATHLCYTYNIRKKVDRVAIYGILKGEKLVFTGDVPDDAKQVLFSFGSPYAPALRKIYLIKHGLD